MIQAFPLYSSFFFHAGENGPYKLQFQEQKDILGIKGIGRVFINMNIQPFFSSPVLLHLTTYVGNSKSASLRPIKVGTGSQTSQSVFAFLLHVLLSKCLGEKCSLIPMFKACVSIQDIGFIPCRVLRDLSSKTGKGFAGVRQHLCPEYYEIESSTSRYSDQCFTK